MKWNCFDNWLIVWVILWTKILNLLCYRFLSVRILLIFFVIYDEWQMNPLGFGVLVGQKRQFEDNVTSIFHFIYARNNPSWSQINRWLKWDCSLPDCCDQYSFVVRTWPRTCFRCGVRAGFVGLSARPVWAHSEGIWENTQRSRWKKFPLLCTCQSVRGGLREHSVLPLLSVCVSVCVCVWRWGVLGLEEAAGVHCKDY